MAHLVISLILTEYEEQRLIKLAYSGKTSVSECVTNLVKKYVAMSEATQLPPNHLEIDLDKT